jgi:hypothetical protein
MTALTMGLGQQGTNGNKEPEPKRIQEAGVI